MPSCIAVYVYCTVCDLPIVGTEAASQRKEGKETGERKKGRGCPEGEDVQCLLVHKVATYIYFSKPLRLFSTY